MRVSLAYVLLERALCVGSADFSRQSRERRQRGFTLIESLVAFAIVSLGTVSVIRLQRDLRFNADLSGQRVEASHLSEGSIERERAAAGLETLPGLSSASSAGRNTDFTVNSAVDSLGATASSAEAANVSVSWPDRTGGSRVVSLQTMVTSASPALAAALSIQAIDPSAGRLANRAASIPMDFKNLGNGQSAWKPSASSDTVWLFDNATGRIVSRCLGASASESTQASLPPN